VRICRRSALLPDPQPPPAPLCLVEIDYPLPRVGASALCPMRRCMIRFESDSGGPDAADDSPRRARSSSDHHATRRHTVGCGPSPSGSLGCRLRGARPSLLRSGSPGGLTSSRSDRRARAWVCGEMRMSDARKAAFASNAAARRGEVRRPFRGAGRRCCPCGSSRLGSGGLRDQSGPRSSTGGG
jgi:hypothetical protein